MDEVKLLPFVLGGDAKLSELIALVAVSAATESGNGYDIAIITREADRAAKLWESRPTTVVTGEGQLREALRKCRDQFEFYVQVHLAKQPPDMDKAASNQEFVEMCDAALAQPESNT